MEYGLTDKQISLLGTEPTIGISISFPKTYSEEDINAIWEAVRIVQIERKIIPFME